MGDPPWDPWGDPPGIPGTPPGTPGAKKSVFLNQKNQIKILSPLLVYILMRATRWDHSQSSRIEKTSIFQKKLKNRFFQYRI